MKRAIALIVLGIALLIACGCDAPALSPQHVVTVVEFGTVPNVVSPSRLDVIMVTDGGESARCDAMGGELHWFHLSRTFTCQGVDY